MKMVNLPLHKNEYGIVHIQTLDLGTPTVPLRYVEIKLSNKYTGSQGTSVETTQFTGFLYLVPLLNRNRSRNTFKCYNTENSSSKKNFHIQLNNFLLTTLFSTTLISQYKCCKKSKDKKYYKDYYRSYNKF